MLQLDDTLEPGSTSTLLVTDTLGALVQGAVISVKVKSQAGTTDLNGQIIIEVPEGATELEIKARLDDDRGELELKLSEEEGPPPLTTGQLSLQLEGDPLTADAVTLVVTGSDGKPVEGALVTVNGEEVGTTDAQGRLTFDVPEGADELKIGAKLHQSVGELEVDLEEGKTSKLALPWGTLSVQV